MTEKSGGLLVLLFFLLLLCLGPPARAQSTSAESTLAAESTSDLGAQLAKHYQRVGTAFWQAENLLDSQPLTPVQRKLLLTTSVPESHPAYRTYFQAAAAADSFLELADENKVENWMCDPTNPEFSTPAKPGTSKLLFWQVEP